MNQVSSPIPKVAVHGVASGVFFMAFFGMLWASIGTGGLQGWGEPWTAIIVWFVGIMLFLGGLSLLFASRRLPDQVAGAGGQQGKRTVPWFLIVFAAEGILIWVANAVCNAINRVDLFFPVMAIIVGVHFIPLAPLFRVKAYYYVGGLLCLLALITLFVVPEGIVFGGQQMNARWIVLGLGATLILWGTGVGLLLFGKRLLSVSKSGAV